LARTVRPVRGDAIATSAAALRIRPTFALGDRTMTARILQLAEDAIAFCATFVGFFLILHLVERFAHGLAMNGVL